MARKFRHLKLFSLLGISILTSIGVISGFSLANKGAERVDASTTQNLSNLKFYIIDQTKRGWDSSPWYMHVWDVTYDSDVNYTDKSVEDFKIYANDNSSTFVNVDNGAFDYKTGSYTYNSSENANCCSIEFPWFIKGFQYKFYIGGTWTQTEHSLTKGTNGDYYNVYIFNYDNPNTSPVRYSNNTKSSKIYSISTAKIGSGTISPSYSAQSVKEYTKINLVATAGTGYSFNSWSDGGAATHSVYAKQDITYTATFTAKTTTVTLDSRGGIGGSTSVTATYGSSMPSITKPTKTGYTFNGYYDATSDGTQYYTASGTSARVWDKDSSTATLYAQWTPNSDTAYTVNHYKQKSSMDGYELADTDCLTGTTGATTSAVAKSYTGFTNKSFAQKTIAADGSTVVDIYYDRNELTLTFNVHGGETLKPKVIYYGVRVGYGVELPNATRQGYLFGGWFTGVDGAGTQVTNETAFESNTTIHAKWIEATKPTYTLNFNSNGGDGNMPSTTPVVEEDYQIPSNAFSKAGYVFDGWSLDSSTGTKSYDDGGTITANTFVRDTTHTLYAIWARSTSVTLESQGGTGGTSNVTATYGHAMPSITTPTKTGYTFNGYYDATSDGTQYYTASGTSARVWDKDSSTATLYAQWTPNSDTAYTVNHYKQKSSMDGYELADTDCLTGTTGATTSAVAKSYTGFTNKSFAQKTIAADGSTVVDIYYDRNELTLYFDVHGGEALKQKVIYYGVRVGYGVELPDATKKDYYFSGWFTAADGKGTRVTNDSAFESDTTIHAYWTVKTSTVTLDSQGGTGGSSTVTARYGSDMPSATMPTKNGHTFNGYFDATSGGKQYYTSTGASATTWDKEAANVTLYAQWTFKRGVYLTGSFASWSRDGSLVMTRNGDEGSTEYYYFGLEVTTDNTEIRVYYDQDDATGWAPRGEISYSHPLAKIEAADDANVKILNRGTYNVYYNTTTGKYHVDRTDYGTLPGWGYGIAVNPSNPTLASEVKGLTPEDSSKSQYEFKNIHLVKDDVVYAYYQGGEAYQPYKMWIQQDSPEKWSYADDDKGLVVPATGTYSFYLLRGEKGFDVVSIVNESGQTDAVQFAVNFTTSIGGECKMDGSTDTNELKIKWELKATEFSGLNPTAQNIIKESFNTPSEVEEIRAFVSLYNYVFAKYGNKLTLTNFAESKVTPSNSAGLPLSIISNGTGLIAVISIISIISVSAIGAYFYLRKRKED